jgi:predicted transglutaminase-like cysteine proteinase
MGKIYILSASGSYQVVRYLRNFALLMLCTLLLPSQAQALSTDESALQERLPVAIKVTPGEARSRIRQWRAFVLSTRYKSEVEKLTAVNDYFNAMHFIKDVSLWREADYWATPLQVLAAGAGDCEDFAIAKYFTLKTLGIAERHLQLLYVWNHDTPTDSREPHMVLTYQASATTEPLVLDILTNDIQPLRQRKGLEPVYGLNSDGLWLMGDNGQVIPAGNPAQLPQWRQLTRAMESEEIFLRTR